MKFIFSVVLLLFCLQFSFAQSYQVKGKVLDSASSKPLAFANIVLQTPKDSVYRATVSDSLGSFQLTQIPKGIYILNISFVGFENHIQELSISENLSLKSVFLKERLDDLGELTIEATAEPVIVKEDTIEFAASAYKLAEDAELEELLKNMPGIEIEDNQITVNGKKIEKILVDGKPFFDNQIKTALKNLPADFVKKIQVIDQKSEEAQFTGHDDGERTPVLNVVSKPEKRKGRFGRLGTTISPPDRYVMSGNIGFLRGKTQFNLNGSLNNLNSSNEVRIPSGMDASQMASFQSGGGEGIGSQRSLGGSVVSELNDKLSLNASLRWNDSESYNSTDISREYIQASDEGRVYNQQSERESQRSSIYSSFSLIYKPSKNNQYTLRQSFSTSNNLSTNSRSGETLLNGELLNSTENNSYLNSEGQSISTKFSWRHKFNKEGRTLSLSLGNSRNESDGEDSVKSVNIFTDGNIQEQRFDQVSAPTGVSITRNASLALTEKVGENSSMRASYKNEFEEDKDDQLLYDFNSTNQAYTDLDPLRSSQYTLTRHNQVLGLNYSLRIKKLTITPRLTYRNTRIVNDQIYPNEVDTDNRFKGLNPGLSINLIKDNGLQAQASFSRSMTIPRATQLQDVLDNSNPLFLKQGNPNLQSGFQNSVSVYLFKVNEETGGYTNLNFYATSLENATTNYTIVGDGTNSPNGIELPVGARYSRPVNISGAKSLNLNLSSSSKLLKDKLRLRYGAGVNYNFSPQFLNEQMQSSETLGYSISAGLNSNFSEKLNLSLNAAPRFSTIKNSNPEEPTNNYFSWIGRFTGKWTIAAEFYITSNISYVYNGGVSSLGSFDQMIWTASLGKKIFKKKLDLNIRANDILRQSSDQNRSVSAEYIENSSSVLLRQVIRINISYKFNKFG